MDIHSSIYEHASKRSTVYAKNGIVATSQPLAAQAGLNILQQGGNAVDAAIATAAALTVLEPTANGIGGDAFALVWIQSEQKLHGLNASGKSVQNNSIEKIKSLGHDEMPAYGWEPVTVPGAPSAWAELSKKFGKLSLAECLAPAIKYAVEGYPLSQSLAYYFGRAFDKFTTVKDEDKFNQPFQHWFDTFVPNGKPQAGDMLYLPDHAKTLQDIADTNGDSFYTGAIAKKIVEFAEQTGGYITMEDLANHSVEWVDPISVNYKGYDIWEIPPNGQGLIALSALNIIKNFEMSNVKSPDDVHKQIEAMKLAFADGKHYITDSRHMSVTNDELLSTEYGKKRASKITDKAQIHCHGDPKSSGTVYLSTADKDGNMVSFIQSNYEGFGSGLVVPNTGIALQNRGHNFSLDEKHDNALQPAKRTYHTIIPGFMTKDNKAVAAFGVMGGFMQPQGHMQVVQNMIDYKMNAQAALDAPRWQWMKGNKISIEKTMPGHIIEQLVYKGHTVEVAPLSGIFGRGQIIIKDDKNNTLIGATEPRTDGTVAAY